QSSRRSIELSRQYPQIRASVGIHPHDAGKVTANWIDELESMAKANTVLAIGETGLDFYRNLSPKKVQESIFREQLRLACRTDKPVIIHSRDAHAETLQILKEEVLPAVKGVMHCFSGDRRWAHAFLDLGFYLSVAGPATYPRSHELRDLLQEIPVDRLLLETDSPYLSPQVYRSKRNEPAYIKFIYEQVALSLDIEQGKLIDQVYANAVRLFSGNLVG
ncbi:MAG TPA: TatD family hydrolase, partial [Candidatus Limnocylindrales bacterium]|nr:TatD family hydrolase [Candidatus Limnocylindrales bacterium]